MSATVMRMPLATGGTHYDLFVGDAVEVGDGVPTDIAGVEEREIFSTTERGAWEAVGFSTGVSMGYSAMRVPGAALGGAVGLWVARRQRPTR